MSRKTEEKKNYIPDIRIEGARLIFRNFSGKEGMYNREGDRNFNVILPPDIVDAVQADGWNVRWLKAREEGDEPTARLEVKVHYNAQGRGPRAYLVTSGGKTELDQNTIKMLDVAQIENVDVVIRPYAWEVNGKTGVKAYLKAIYVTIVEDEFDRKYAHLERADSATTANGGPDFEDDGWGNE